MKKKLVAAFVALAMPIAMANPAAAADKQVAGLQKEANEQKTNEAKAKEMTEALEVIESIPDEVLLQGDEATREWLQNDPKAQEATQEASALGCTASILSLIGGNMIVAGKLLKIKRLIQDLGGVVSAVRHMAGAGFNYEKLKHGGGAIFTLASELFGIEGVRTQCFN